MMVDSGMGLTIRLQWMAKAIMVSVNSLFIFNLIYFGKRILKMMISN